MYYFSAHLKHAAALYFTILKSKKNVANPFNAINLRINYFLTEHFNIWYWAQNADELEQRLMPVGVMGSSSMSTGKW